jgi:hypothetical protein
MTDPDGATCVRCGAPISSGDPTGLCPRCYLPDTRGDQTQTPPVRSSSRGEARRKLTLASAFAAIGAIVLGVPWLGNRRAQEADAEAHSNLGCALSDM